MTVGIRRTLKLAPGKDAEVPGLTPDGVTAISRWLSEATPPGNSHTIDFDPGGVAQELTLVSQLIQHAFINAAATPPQWSDHFFRIQRTTNGQ